MPPKRGTACAPWLRVTTDLTAIGDKVSTIENPKQMVARRFPELVSVVGARSRWHLARRC